MKNERITHWAFILLFVAFIGVFAALFVLFPKAKLSELERRSLADAPKITADTLFSGTFGKEAETYLSDHFPARSTWVGLHAGVEWLTGRNGQNGIYLGENQRLYTAPISCDYAKIDRNCAAITDFAVKSGTQVHVLIVPSAGSLNDAQLPTLHSPYRDNEILSYISNKVNVITPDLSVDHFYRTDHHWTTAGAYRAYVDCADVLGFAPLPESHFNKEKVEGFYGTSYAKAGLWQIKPDTMELWHSQTPITVTIQDDAANAQEYTSIFFREHLNTMDMYSVFLDGNHGRVRLTNSQGEGKLLVIKDSFAQTLVPFLAEHYAQIDMIDLRHFRRTAVSDFAAQEGYTDVLLIYGIESVAASNDLLWLQ